MTIRPLAGALLIITQTGCLFSAATDLPDIGRTDVGKTDVGRDVGSTDVRKDSGRDIGRDLNGNDVAADVSTDSNADSDTGPTNPQPLPTDVEPLDIRILDGDPFQIVVMGSTESEYWTYDPATQAAPVLVATIGERGQVLSVARSLDGLHVATGSEKLSLCGEECVSGPDPRGLVAIGSDSVVGNDGTERLALFAATFDDEKKEYTIDFGSNTSATISGTEISARSFPNSRNKFGAMVVNRPNAHTVVSRAGRFPSNTILTYPIPIHTQWALGFDGRPTAAAGTLIAVREGANGVTIHVVAEDVSAFDAYRYDDVTYVAWASKTELTVKTRTIDNALSDIARFDVDVPELVAVAASKDFAVLAAGKSSDVQLYTVPLGN